MGHEERPTTFGVVPQVKPYAAMTQAHITPLAVSARRYDLDAIRIGAFALLILYHVGMFYVPWDWHVDSQRPQEWLEPVMRFTNPWRLTLLFLVSGAATRLLYQSYLKQGAGAAERLGGSRLLRLGLPLLFAMLVIVPPQSYYEVVQHVRDNALAADIYHNSLTADFWLRYVTAKGGWCGPDGCLITPTWNHLWFVAYVLFYGLLAAMVAGVAGARLDHGSQVMEKALSGIGVLVWPIAFLVLIRIGLAPRFPVTHDFVQDLYTHALSLSAYAFGFLLVAAPKVTNQLVRYRHVSLALALASYAAYAIYMASGSTDQGLLPRNVMRGVYAVDQWAFIAAILGYAAKHVHGTSPLMKYLGGGIFTFYIVHQTLIVMVTAHIEALRLPLFLEMGLVVAVTCAGCVLSYEIAKRIGIFGMLLGVSLGRKQVSTAAMTVEPPAPQPAR